MNPPERAPAARPVAAVVVDPPGVGWRFVSLYALSYAGGSLLFLGPLLVSLALKVNAPGRHRRRTEEPRARDRGGVAVRDREQPVLRPVERPHDVAAGHARPWMIVGLVGGAIGTLTVALAPTIAVVLVGWCIAQVFLNALLAAQVAILPDQVPTAQRGLVSGILGVCLPAASVAATYLVQAFDGAQLTMFLAPLLVGGVLVGMFTAYLQRPAAGPRTQAAVVAAAARRVLLRQPTGQPRLRLGLRQPVHAGHGLRLPRHVPGVLPHRPDRRPGGRRRPPDLPRHGWCSPSPSSSRHRWPAGSRTGSAGGRSSSSFAAVTYAVALAIIATADGVGGYLVGMAVSGVGFGMYMAVDLALVVDVLPDPVRRRRTWVS